MEQTPPLPGKHRQCRAAQLRSALKVVWVNLIVLVFGVIFLELAGYLYYTARAATSGAGDPAAARVDRIPSDAYADRSWLMPAFRELAGSGRPNWVPYSYWRAAPFSGQYLNIDASGLRRTWNMPATKPIEIYMFGGSTTKGIGARDDYTIPSSLSKMLAEIFPSRLRVTNYGQTGYVNTQEMISLFHEIETGAKPDIVIFFDGYNDSYAAYEERVAGVSLNEHNRIAEFNILNRTRARDFLWEALKRSNIYNLLEGAHDKIWGSSKRSPLPPERRAELVADVLKYYATNLNIIEAVGHKMGFIPLFFWQPAPFAREPLNDVEKFWPDDPEGARIFPEVYAAAKHSSFTAMPSFHDISDVFRGHEGTLYIDYIHTTERGNEIIARRILQDVAPVVNQVLQHR